MKFFDLSFKEFFGLVLITIWAILIIVIALGKVEEATSFGLRDCITGLAFLSGSWAQATFGHTTPKDLPLPTATPPSPPSS